MLVEDSIGIVGERDVPSGGLRATRLVFFVRAFLLGDKAVMRVRNVVNQGIVFEYLFSLFLRATLSSLLVD